MWAIYSIITIILFILLSGPAFWWNWLQGQFVSDPVTDETIETQDSTSSAEEEEEHGSSSYSADIEEDNLPEEGFEDIVGEEDDDSFEMMVD